VSLHESDSDIEVKLGELREREQVLDKELQQIRKYQININSLKMVASYEILDVVIDKKTLKNKALVYSLPNDFTGNKMTEKTRTLQKIALSKNIDKLLGVKHE